MTTNSPEPHEIFDYFSKTTKGLDKTFFNMDYEPNVKAFLDKYDKGEIAVSNTLEIDIFRNVSARTNEIALLRNTP